VGYYLEKSGRSDLQSRALAEPKFTIQSGPQIYFLLQGGRTYFENQDKLKEVRDRFRLIYAGFVEGHTAVEVYATPVGPNEMVTPCGNARP
jgi:hypothetical protein